MRFGVAFNRVSRRWMVIDRAGDGDVVATCMTEGEAVAQAAAEEKRAAPSKPEALAPKHPGPPAA